MGDTDMRVALLIIGNEILRGDTLDSNSNFLASGLVARGARVCRIVTIPDDLELIVRELRSLAEEFDRVITTGGIGPTPDDLTRDAVARAFGRPTVLFEDAVAEWKARRGGELNEGQLAMCTMPARARLIRTNLTSAPGFIVDNVYVLAGVPSVMKEMWAVIAPEFSGPVQAVAGFTVRLPESQFAGVLRRFQQEHPGLDFGSYPKMEGDWYSEIKVIGPDREYVDSICLELKQAVAALGD